jgi:hypothetical protein
MSRGGEAFGRRPPPPPLILGPPHYSTQAPRVVFPTKQPHPHHPPPQIQHSTGRPPPPQEKQQPLSKDANAVFSKVEGGESDAHPLLGITPAAPGEAFDFNPILSNPAVTRILAGSSGRIPQWEPSLPDLHGE